MRARSVPLADYRLRWSAVVAVVAVIFYASVVVVPGPAPRETLGPWWDELLHALAYASLALALAYATAEWTGAPARRVILVVALAAGYGLCIELVQAPVPYRRFSVSDIVANVGGALLVIGWFRLESRIRYRPRDSER